MDWLPAAKITIYIAPLHLQVKHPKVYKELDQEKEVAKKKKAEAESIQQQTPKEIHGRVPPHPQESPRCKND